MAPKQLEQKSFTSSALGTSFLFRRTKAMDTVEVGLRQARILNGVAVAAVHRDTADLAYVIAAMNTVMIDPKEYDWDAVEELQDILDLYDQWYQWNQSFRKSVAQTVASPS